MADYINFPPQTLPFSKKTKEWRKQCVSWAKDKTYFNYSLVRKTIQHKKINYDLLNGKLHMSDLETIVNPDRIEAGFIPEKIQHYPIINSKLNVLKGEEIRRTFDYRVIITNPNSISEIENNKKSELLEKLQQLIEDTSQSEDQYNAELQKLNEYYTYEWQDMREIRANALLNHYVKEYNMPLIFNQGFMDAMIVGEEIYQCDIVGGEPIIERLNPLKVRVFKSGYSNRIEDADIIILEDYWSPGRIIDTYYESLSKKDIEYIEKLPDNVGTSNADSMDNIDDRLGFVNMAMVGEEGIATESLFSTGNLDMINNSMLPYDLAGNVRVLKVYWKSRRRIKKVKSFDLETGEEVYNFYPETYKINKDLGEEEFNYYINEAWEGILIGEDIFINMRPRVIQYNRLSNPSRCHFGIIGSIYNLNDSKPFSLVDMMKPYNYLYDAIHDRLNKAIANNWGAIMELDLSQVPKGWSVEQWLYYAKVNKIAVKDSFKEGNIGSATGKLAGSFANNSRGMLSASDGNYIQQLMNLLEFIKMEMSEVAGISKQREGQIASRETVGGVERATLQSSHITEWLFTIHEDLKRRVLECFIETAKIALKGQSKKFQYILSDTSMKMMDIDGDEFSESDYGLAVDNSQATQKLAQSIDTLAQAALQNNALSFSTIFKLYSSASLAEKQKLIERDELAMQERNSQAQQQQFQAQQQIAQMDQDMKMQEMQLKDSINMRDNETKLLIANINSANLEDGIDIEMSEEARANLEQKIKEFDAKIKLDKEKLDLEKTKHKDNIAVKKAAINKTKKQ